ncbi:dicarbixylic amino acid permease [Suillus subalutaceus]|uniref:dicarbixylic amino acid permease n=1 Tax=Suillus subalutaceus TaxID=48586 RepID=UPI001B87F835|nr:dicarbixylic amino acid permease [Suillus subalutaceus]KAG1837044.1 dicarbixylic amino acid permease [Suillus subalutaceus]
MTNSRLSGSATEDVDEKFYRADDLQDPHESTLHRGLKARQMSMIALGGTIGTGLIMSSGTALVQGGPLGLCLGFLFVGLICFLTLAALGEMTAYLPHKKGFAGYATRFVDPALGFALGWVYLIKYLIAPASNINAAGIVMQYWTLSVPIEVWAALYMVLVVIMNLLGIRFFGELEFWMSGLKIVSLMGLILLGIIIDLGGNPKHDRIGFRYWRQPNGPMGSYLVDQVHNEQLAVFLGFWSTLTTALFAYIGSELVAVTAGEAQNPRKSIPRAIKSTFFRIFVFYIGCVFVISLIVPSTSTQLLVANSSRAGAAASPFVVGVTLVGIKGLNHVINAMILLFTISAANSDLYIASRTLYGLAIERKAPQIFAKVNKRGVPWVSLLFVSLFISLTFLNASTSSSTVFAYGVNLLSAFGAITWMTIAYSHIRFMQALKAQGISRDSLPYKGPCQPLGSWFVLVSTGIILLFKGFFTVFNIGQYLPVPLFFIFWLGYKIRHRTRVIPSSKVDLITGKREIDEEEELFTLREKAREGKMSRWQRLVDVL